MGWWPLNIRTGGINWGKSNNDDNKMPGIVNVVATNAPLPDSELVWGDGPADIVDKWMEDEMKPLFDKLNVEFIDEMGREMGALEFLSGLAFSLPGICHPDYSSSYLKGLPICETHSLDIQVLPEDRKRVAIKLADEHYFLCSWNGTEIVEIHTKESLYEEYNGTNLFDDSELDWVDENPLFSPPDEPKD